MPGKSSEGDLWEDAWQDELDEAGSEEEQEEEEAIKEPISLPAVACVMADASSDTPQQQPYDLSDTAASVTLNSTKEGLTYRGGQHCPTSVDGTQWSPDTKPSAATCSFKSNALVCCSMHRICMRLGLALCPSCSYTDHVLLDAGVCSRLQLLIY